MSSCPSSCHQHQVLLVHLFNAIYYLYIVITSPLPFPSAFLHMLGPLVPVPLNLVVLHLLLYSKLSMYL
ncbi:hypothetical protein E2C01_051574 [Portunus trituberculatus]|uniref:Uncharacterized protein n=1 Tax=Portunus trituberculatus TaxID=210409 RepID=A0A5B7GBZ5_PORTR|nr:hypothetical protein [Portunus trituberculatus]